VRKSPPTTAALGLAAAERASLEGLVYSDLFSASKQPKASLLLGVQARVETKAEKTQPRPFSLKFSAA